MQLADTLALLQTRRGFPLVARRAFDLFVFGVRNNRQSNRFDDAIGCAYRETDDGPVKLELWRGTVEPGRSALRDPMHPRGVFRTGPGRDPLCWTLGYHKQSTAGTTRPALVQVAKAKIRGFRDNDGDEVQEDILPADDVGGCNVHDGMTDDPNQDVDGKSEGCWVTKRAFILRLRWLVEQQKARGLGDKVSRHQWDVDQDPEARAFLAAVGVAA